HSRGEVAAGPAEHHDGASGHVLAAVIPDALDDSGRARVADGEALAREAPQEEFAAGGAVQGHVPDQDRLLGHEPRPFRWVGDDPSAGEALPDVVVRFAFQAEGDSADEERTEALSGRPGKVEANGVVRKRGASVAAGDLTREHRADGP